MSEKGFLGQQFDEFLQRLYNGDLVNVKIANSNSVCLVNTEKGFELIGLEREIVFKTEEELFAFYLGMLLPLENMDAIPKSEALRMSKEGSL